MVCLNLLEDILTKHHSIKIDELRNQKSPRVVYYTDASTAFKILDKQEIWMRNASLMNDYSEINYGLDLIIKSFGRGTRFFEIMKTLSVRLEQDDLFSDFANFFDSWIKDLRNNTFLTCVSKHRDNEDDFGRLSMWRAYGGDNGVAIVFDAEPLLREESKLGVYSVPVLYWKEEKALNIYDEIVSNLEECVSYLTMEDWPIFKNHLTTYLKLHIISLKHPGFSEEDEWRIFYRPNEGISRFANVGTEVLGGTPQIIHKLNLSKEGRISVSEILDRIIIGPATHQYEIADALSFVLFKNGVKKPQNLIKVSEIPLRS